MVYNQQYSDKFLSLTVFTLSVRALADSIPDSEWYMYHLF